MEICGITPDAMVLRLKISPYFPRAITPSWIRAPPESRIPTSGTPVEMARSIILMILFPAASPREPPKIVKSCEKRAIWRPWMVPKPVTTESPYGRLASMPKAVER